MPNTVYLSLGSNLQPEKNMVAATRMLAQYSRLLAISSVWESAPVGLTAQPNFLNAAAMIETELTAVQLKTDVLATIERDLGRVRQADKNAPRPMDLDIMLFNNQIFELGQRHIPDPEVLERPFVAIPLSEIAPHYIHPETGQTLRQIAARFILAASPMRPRPDVSKLVAQVVENN